MNLKFPNANRFYSARRNQVQFWGYDGALEIPFFIDANALEKLDPQTKDTEAARLSTFDAALERIHNAARKLYSRNCVAAYNLVADNF